MTEEQKETDERVAQELEVDNTADDIAPDSPVPEEKTEVSQDTTVVSASYKIILLIVVLLSGAALAASYMLWMQMKKSNADLSLQTDKQIKQYLQVVEDAQERKSQQVTIAINENRNSNQQIRKMLESIRKVIDEQSKGDIKLVQAESVLRFAKIRYETLHDLSTTIIALELSLELLKDFTNPVIAGIKNQVSLELQSVKDLVVPDISSELINLDVLVKSIDSLPLLSATVRDLSAQSSDPDVKDVAEKSLGEKFKGMLKALQPLVTVRRTKGATVPMLGAEEERLVRLILKSRYEQIRQALINKDSTLLRSGVSSIQQWLSKYFDADKEVVKDALARLEQWGNMDLDINYPSIGLSLQQLIDLRAQGQLQTTP
ncbi:MAG: hypothetical protein GXP13_04335 [Gammaproteobacteria bacterium]|nr:hypothetical protein [Gammaproteobacteria bacterium]